MMAEKDVINIEFDDELKNEYLKHFNENLNIGVKYFAIINLIFDCLIILLILFSFFNIINIGFIVFIFIISLIGFYLPFGGSIFLFFIGHIISHKKTKITKYSYYSPGWRSSISEIDIDEEGICLHWKKKDIYIKDSTPYYEYIRIPYDKIIKIQIQTFTNFFSSPGKFYEIKTKDNRIGHISSN